MSTGICTVEAERQWALALPLHRAYDFNKP